MALTHVTFRSQPMDCTKPTAHQVRTARLKSMDYISEYNSPCPTTARREEKYGKTWWDSGCSCFMGRGGDREDVAFVWLRQAVSIIISQSLDSTNFIACAFENGHIWKHGGTWRDGFWKAIIIRYNRLIWIRIVCILYLLLFTSVTKLNLNAFRCFTDEIYGLKERQRKFVYVLHSLQKES
jgi:hypothetical protein